MIKPWTRRIDKLTSSVWHLQNTVRRVPAVAVTPTYYIGSVMKKLYLRLPVHTYYLIIQMTELYTTLLRTLGSVENSNCFLFSPPPPPSPSPPCDSSLLSWRSSHHWIAWWKTGLVLSAPRFSLVLSSRPSGRVGCPSGCPCPPMPC